MTSLYPSLIRLVERAIQSHVEGYSSGIFPGPEERWPRLGRHFSLQKDGGTSIIYPWMGIYDSAWGSVIYIGLGGQPGWCEMVYEAVLAGSLSEGRTYRTPYKDILRTELCFALKEDNLDWLKSSKPGEEYEKLLLVFFAETVRYIGQYL